MSENQIHKKQEEQLGISHSHTALRGANIECMLACNFRKDVVCLSNYECHISFSISHICFYCPDHPSPQPPLVCSNYW